MAMKKYSKCRGDSAESLRDSLMLLGRWLKTWMHKIKEPRTRSPKTTAKLIQNNVYCFLNITIFRLAIPAFFRVSSGLPMLLNFNMCEWLVMNRKGPWEGYRQALCCPLSPSRLLAKTKMAEVGKNPLPSGYEYEFISTVLDDLHCLICHLPLREPVLTRCGHRFCKNCLDEAIRRYENRTRILSLSLCCKLTFKLGD